MKEAYLFTMISKVHSSQPFMINLSTPSLRVLQQEISFGFMKPMHMSFIQLVMSIKISVQQVNFLRKTRVFTLMAQQEMLLLSEPILWVSNILLNCAISLLHRQQMII